MTRWIAGMLRTALAACAAMTVAGCVATANGQQFALKDGDTVVFYGDSITAQRFYTRFVEDFLLTRYPNLHIRFVNAGVPGDTVRGGYTGSMQERVQRDVAPFHPTKIAVMLGMNDGGWGYGTEKTHDDFKLGYQSLLAELHKAAPGASFTLIGCTPYDEITHGTEFPGYSKDVARDAEDVVPIAAALPDEEKKDLVLTDFQQPMTEALENAKAKYPELAPLLIPDRIHPAEAGHWIMAAALMSAWHVDPVVSTLALNAANAQVIGSARTTVTQLEAVKNGLSWTQLDEALPLPFDFNNAMTAVLLGVSRIEDVDRQILRVEGVAGDEYQLLIDGKPIAQFTREQLSAGVNLAFYKTPMVEQARGIDGREEQRAALDQARFILSTEIGNDASLASTEIALRQAQERIDTSLRKDLQPKPHHFELRQK